MCLETVFAHSCLRFCCPTMYIVYYPVVRWRFWSAVLRLWIGVLTGMSLPTTWPFYPERYILHTVDCVRNLSR